MQLSNAPVSFYVSAALGEEREAMIIVANCRHICWAREHSSQSTVFKNPLSSTQIQAGNASIVSFLKLRYWLVPKSVP